MTSSQRPRSAWIHFLMDKKHRSEVRSAHPSATFGTVSKLLGQQWKALDADARIPYERIAERERDAYVAPVKGAVKARALEKVRNFVASLPSAPQESVAPLAVVTDTSPPSDPVVTDTSPPSDAESTATTRRTYRARAIVCKTFPFAGSLFQGPNLTREERLTRRYKRIKATELRRAGARTKVRATHRRRPLCCSMFPFAASLFTAPTKVSHEIRLETWLQSTLSHSD